MPDNKRLVGGQAIRVTGWMPGNKRLVGCQAIRVTGWVPGNKRLVGLLLLFKMRRAGCWVKWDKYNV